MTLLNPVGLTRDEKHVYYWNGQAYPSVTTIIKVVDKSGPLVGWAKRETAACAVRNLDMLAQMRATGGDQAAVDWLKRIPDYQRDTAADIGSTVHGLVESLSRGVEIVVPDELAGFVRSFQRWQAEFAPRYLAAEEMTISLKHGFAGTLDAIVDIGGEVWLIDYKTGSGVYGETALQLAAYSHADFIGRPGQARKFRIPKATQYAVLHIRPEGYEFIPFAVDRSTFDAFLAAKALYDWQQTYEKTAKGQPLGPRIAKAS
jgi:hypothetical protein